VLIVEETPVCGDDGREGGQEIARRVVVSRTDKSVCATLLVRIAPELLVSEADVAQTLLSCPVNRRAS